MSAADESDPAFREKLLRAFARLTPEEMKRIDQAWKSNMDKKVDRLVSFANAYEGYLKICVEREVDNKLMRRALIEKTFFAFVIFMLGVIGTALWHYLRDQLK